MLTNISENIKKYLIANKIVEPTEVQSISIPKLLKYKNLLVESPTGTGKTLSYLIPIIENMSKEGVQGVIFTPTRELGKQIYDVLQEIKKFVNNIDVALFIGGEDSNRQMNKANKSPNIIIATPDRINKINELSKIDYSNLKYVILDEADMILKFGLLNQVIKFKDEKTNPKVTWALFSATLPLEIQNFMKKDIGSNFENVVILKNNSSIKNFTIDVQDKDRYDVLLKLITSDKFNPYLAMIFSNSNEEAKEIYDFLNQNEIEGLALYTSQLSPRERKQIVNQINDHKKTIVITTDVMSRGIDILGISHVINFSFPADLSFYRHRIGRTNRNNISGIVYTFHNDLEKEKIEKLKTLNPFIKFERYKSWN